MHNILKVIHYAKIIYEKLPTRYSNINSGYSSPYYLGASVGDSIITQLSDINKICHDFIQAFKNRLPLIVTIIDVVFFESNLKWELVDIILEYLEQEPIHDAEMLEEQLGITYESIEPPRENDPFVTPVKKLNLVISTPHSNIMLLSNLNDLETSLALSALSLEHKDAKSIHPNKKGAQGLQRSQSWPSFFNEGRRATSSSIQDIRPATTAKLTV